MQRGWKVCLHSKKFLSRGLLASRCTPRTRARTHAHTTGSELLLQLVHSDISLTGSRKTLWTLLEGEREQVSGAESAEGQGRTRMNPRTHARAGARTYTLCFVTYHRGWSPNKISLIKLCLMESWFKPPSPARETSPFHPCSLRSARLPEPSQRRKPAKMMPFNARH